MISRTISEFVAIAALIILLTYIADAAIGQGKSGFLPLTAGQRGMIFGTSSIVLFFVAIGIGFKERSRVTGGLVTAGGAIMGTSVLVASAMGEGGLGSIRGSCLGLIIVGYIIMGLGILMLVRTKKAVG
jgi:hypothetical protein